MRWVLLVAAMCAATVGLADQSVYSDQLDNSWQNWSWASVNFSSKASVFAGTYSIAVTETGANQAIYLHHDAQSASSYQALVFYINGGATGGQLLQVNGTLGTNAQVAYNLPALPKNSWVKVTVPLAGIGVKGASNFDGFWIQDRSGSIQGTYYVDSISLQSAPTTVASQTMYDDALQNTWASASTASLDLANKTTVHGGTAAIAVTETAAKQYLKLKHAQLDASLYTSLKFWVNGGTTGGQLLQVVATTSGVAGAAVSVPALTKGTWQQVTIPLADLGVGARGDLDSFAIQGRATSANGVYYVDDVSLSVDAPINPATSVTVDASRQTAISPLIYGMNSTDFAGMGKGFTFTRMGGNRLTAYNWENNASNAGSDWYFQNDNLMGATDEPGWAGRTFVQTSIANGAIPIVTIPTAGYVAADKKGDGDVRTTPNFLTTRFKKSIAAKSGGKWAYPPVTTDANVYADEYVVYLKSFAKSGFPVMFSLDNEPDLWQYTHNEIHPKPVTYAELLANNTTYATAIKYVYPTSTVFGFVSYGWYGYRALQGAPDANGRDFMNFYLDGMKKAETTAKKRLVDVLDLHWYPEAQGDGQRITGDGDSPGLRDARIQAPRSLWDPTYVENSWITQSMGNKAIQLLPDTFGRINTYYPGTKLSFTEYNYGGSNAISGAIAQADVLGIFGRYGVYAAANWGLGSGSAAQLGGFRSFINFDGKGSKFGDLALAVTGETASQNSVYAAVDKSNSKRMTLVVINKTSGVTPFTINLTKFTANSAQGYSVVDGKFLTPISTPVTATAGQLQFSAPPYSVTTIVVAAKVP